MGNLAARGAILAFLSGCGGGDEGAPPEPDLVLLSFPCGPRDAITRTALSLESPELKPWLDRISRHHEVPLRWEQLEWTERVGGFEERTTLGLDVTVLEAHEYVYVPKASSECRAQSRRSMTVEIRLATADGAFEGTERHTLGFFPGYEESSPRLDSPQLFDVRLERFARTFELGPEPPLDADPESVLGSLRMSFSFQEDGLRGSLQPALYGAPGAYGARPSWAPLEGHFPYPCWEGEALDREWEELGGIPRALYDEYLSQWPKLPVTAWYRHSDDRFDAQLDQTRLTVSVGPLARVCRDPDVGLRFFGPLALESSDGRVRFAREMATELLEGHGSSTATSPLASAAELESVFGLQGFDLRSAARGSARFEVSVGAGMFGRLGVAREVSQLERYLESEPPLWGTPMLVWCAGSPACGP